MSRYYHFIVFVALILAAASCKKNDAAPDWNQQLKNSWWAGAFSYSSGAYRGLQPFSVHLGAEGACTWSDEASTRPAGTWAIAGNQLTITLPNSTTLSAAVSETGWSSISTSGDAGFSVSTVQVATVPDPTKLKGATWTGSIDGTSFSIEFTGESTLVQKWGAATYALNYTVEGAGIRFEQKNTLTSYLYYGIFQDADKVLRGTQKYTKVFPPAIRYEDWTASRQLIP